MYTLYNPKQHVETPYLFFTGKGGVGKTSVACATAVALADQGKKVLLVSTDPASNLQDVFEIELSREPVEIPSVKNLFASNIDPEEASRAYREKTVGPYRDKLPESVVNQMEEQLSGACTVEIAAFDEFSHLLADDGIFSEYDHVLFDTAPTGHTLRLLSLPTAWSGYLEEATHGASCLGPLSGLGDKKAMYQKAVESLSDGDKTTLILVARPEESTLIEANRASLELGDIGIQKQMLIINGLLQSYEKNDEVSTAFYEGQHEALTKTPEESKKIQTFSLPFVSYSLTGIDRLRQIVSDAPLVKFKEDDQGTEFAPLSELKDVIDDFSSKNTRVIFTMGKGGVGKTSVAAAIAVGLTEKGHKVHLTTTDPAAHLDYMFQNGTVNENLSISSINPEVEVEAYKKEVITNAGELNDDELAYLQEDLESPCTEEIAVFRAFADVVERSEQEIVVIDTAPTGHTLLLLDSSEAYHREMSRSTGEIPESVKKLLPRLRNPEETGVVVVTLPEATPVFEATRLQDDLKRAEITPKWWVINRSLYATGTTDKVLKARAASERQWIKKVQEELADNSALIPWMKEVKIGYDQLKEFVQL
ncbi:arsenical pump-driving ATPase [Virgibacillus dakarensis]|uniref:Arsenical pump-driving ATPase n=1 Tax=Virgibacillus halodenitrificans TaxID=1482 RepID=A0AAC9J190_VIRHA|nr:MULTISPECIES: arsenical pump-driving ATPase [Virgibacillus]APC49065.1 arsenical pump-driving ATPase [Virgibacillus halodenitrificans]MBT2217873.1 arsenical pump-driving ATPase [Virgibacillus dakarensis]MTW87552.1 arsenical pump-driving ATPase [Virgibacillus dakarensis]